MEKVILTKALVFAALVVLLGGCQMFAAKSGDKSPAAPGKQEEALPGSKVSLDVAAKSAEIIAVATITRASVHDPSGLGAADYTAEIEITRLLKGETKVKKLSLDYRVRSIPDKIGKSGEIWGRFPYFVGKKGTGEKGTPIYEQVSVKSEAVRKRIASSRLFGVVAPDAPDYRIRPGPIHNHGVP